MRYPDIQFRLLNARRQVVAIPDPLRFMYSREANKPGGFELVIPTDEIERSTLDIVTRVQVWRRDAPGMSFRYENEYLNRKPIERRERDRRKTFTLGSGEGGVIKLLKSRIIHAAKGTAYAAKLGFVTDVMRAYVREQCTASAGSERAFYDTLTVQADTGDGPSVNKDAARAYVLDTLQALVKAAAEPTPYQADVFFDLAPQGDGWLFHVKTGQPGEDRGLASPSPVVLLTEADLEDWEYEVDAEKEITVVYVGGQEVAGVQPITTVTDDSRLHNPPGNRWEMWHNVSNQADSVKLATEGATKLDEGAPFRRLRGTLAQGLYGPRVRYGMRLVMQAPRAVLREAVVTAVKVTGQADVIKDEVRLEA
jgi:hypothetical protein